MVKSVKQQKEVAREVDVYSRVLQIIGLIVFGIITVVDLAVKESDVPVWIQAGILGVAIGLSPEQFYALAKDVIKSVFSVKK